MADNNVPAVDKGEHHERFVAQYFCVRISGRWTPKVLSGEDGYFNYVCGGN